MLQKKDLEALIEKYEKSLKNNYREMDNAKDEDDYRYFSYEAATDEKSIDLLRYLLRDYYD